MFKIVILAFEGAVLSSIALPLDIFNSSGVLWNRLVGVEIDPRFSVRVATPGGRSIKCFQTVTIAPDCAMEEVDDVDLVMVAALPDLSNFPESRGDMLAWLKMKYAAGTQLASVCTGAFLLAATGLLDGKCATTHWGLAQLLQQQFPAIKVLPKRIVTDEGDLYCSGGANAGGDLALHIVRKYCGNEVAHQCGQALLLDPARKSQAPYEVFNFEKGHGDDKIATLQEWLERNYRKQVKIDSLARQAAMSRRTFERRFKAATGESPLQYLQRIRIDKAKMLLEKGDESFDRITDMVGYGDSSSFRKVFQKFTSMQPGAYRRKFRRFHYSP